MGGAFVAVANDSSATWWNPAGLARWPFVDVAIGRAVTERNQQLPARRDRVSWIAVGTPPFGFSYYRLRITEIRRGRPYSSGRGDREDGQGGVPVRSLAVSQFGVTVVQTLLRRPCRDDAEIRARDGQERGRGRAALADRRCSTAATTSTGATRQRVRPRHRRAGDRADRSGRGGGPEPARARIRTSEDGDARRCAAAAGPGRARRSTATEAGSCR